MGVILILKAPGMKIERGDSLPKFKKGLFVGGFVFSGISPGFFVWWATIGISTIVVALSRGFIGVIVLMIGHWLADLVWLGSLSFAVDKGKKHLSERLYHNILRFFACALVTLGIILIIRQM